MRFSSGRLRSRTASRVEIGPGRAGHRLRDFYCLLSTTALSVGDSNGMRYAVCAAVVIMLGCTGLRTPDADGNDAAVPEPDTKTDVIKEQVVEIATLDAVSSLPDDHSDEQSPNYTPSDSVPEGGDDQPMAGADTTAEIEGTEGRLCTYGDGVVGIEIDGECAVPAERSYELTCGTQRCEKDWCDTTYRDAEARRLVTGMLYCSDEGCACRCRADLFCVRDDVVYCGAESC